ncbi:hypothetical protein AGRA3207_002752 [Actinomadura graeca]|uniref:Uncharacterized protein n=1 Tax=Actinomadura graeca TaxID=2750812 RepID=A0ABX8QSN5_9ACTN|nr:hypothetical protein [Actinomadura graeca]QXJ21850.1 hypothetical protein AGRA3207_002752 [Actinomadura graeca]
MEHLPLPDPDLVRAARRHLTSRYASGVEAVLWEMHKHPMHDLDAVGRVLESETGPSATDDDGTASDDGAGDTAGDEGTRRPAGPASAMDVGAAFMVLLAARQDTDRLEAALFGRALHLGLGYEQIAAVLGLPDARTARRRHEEILDRARAPSAGRRAPLDERSAQRRARDLAVRRRAEETAQRADEAARLIRRLLRSQVPELMPDSGEPLSDKKLFWQDPEEQSLEAPSRVTPSPVGDDDGGGDAAGLAARRAEQARRFNAAAGESAARAREEAARRREEAAQAGRGDVTGHRRLADGRRGAAQDDCDDLPDG